MQELIVLSSIPWKAWLKMNIQDINCKAECAKSTGNKSTVMTDLQAWCIVNTPQVQSSIPTYSSEWTARIKNKSLMEAIAQMKWRNKMTGIDWNQGKNDLISTNSLGQDSTDQVMIDWSQDVKWLYQKDDRCYK